RRDGHDSDGTSISDGPSIAGAGAAATGLGPRRGRLRCRARLAGRAPVGGTLPGAVALVGDPDGGAAAQTGAGRAAVDEEVLLAPPRGVAGRAVAVGLQEPLGESGDARGVLGREGADGKPGSHPQQEAELALVDVADAGEVALVEQRLTERAG